MLKKLSKQGEYTHFLVISIILLIFYFTPPVQFTSDFEAGYMGPIGIWLTNYAMAYPIYAKIISMIIIIFISLYINRTTASSDIFPKQSFLSATLLTSFLLFSPPFPDLAAGIALVVLLGFCLGSMINMFGKQYPYLQVLNASMAVALASMIIPHAILFMVFIWFAFFTYSVNSWREWIISIIGLLIPYLYMFFAYFWNNNLDYIFKFYESIYFTGFFNFNMPSVYFTASLSLLLVFFVISAFSFTNEASDKIISIRKRMWLIFQFSLICSVIIMLGTSASFIFILLLYMPLAVMVTYSVHNQKKSRIFDVLITMFVISVLINRIFA